MGTVVFIFENIVKPIAALVAMIVAGSLLAALCVYVFGKVVGAF